MKKLVLLLMFLWSYSLFSQTDDARLYFNDGTSVEGLGMIKKNKIIFKVSKEGIADEWTYEDVKGIRFFGFEMESYFEYVTLYKNSKPELLEVLADGNVKLYVEFLDKTLLTLPSFTTINKKVNNQDITIRKMKTPTNTYGKSDTFVYYLKRETEEFPTQIKGNYVKKTSEYFKDCEFLVKKIKAYEYDWEHIDQIVVFYNDICSE